MNFLSSLSELEEHCVKLLTALSNIGGPVTGAACMIQNEWIEIVRDETGERIEFECVAKRPKLN